MFRDLHTHVFHGITLEPLEDLKLPQSPCFNCFWFCQELMHPYFFCIIPCQTTLHWKKSCSMLSYYSWGNSADVKILSSVVKEHMSYSSMLRGSGQQWTGKNPDQCCFNTEAATGVPHEKVFLKFLQNWQENIFVRASLKKVAGCWKTIAQKCYAMLPERFQTTLYRKKYFAVLS